MAMQSDVWAITPSTSATLLRAAAAVGLGGETLTLLTNQVAPNGAGYKIRITSSGDDSALTVTVVGNVVGDLTGKPTTEVLTGPNTTADTTNYYSSIISITFSAATANNISVGTTGSLALPRTRIKGLYYVAAANAGSVAVNSNGSSGSLILQVDTPAVTAGAFATSIYMPAEGIFTGRSSPNDFAVVTLTQVSKVTLICG